MTPATSGLDIGVVRMDHVDVAIEWAQREPSMSSSDFHREHARLMRPGSAEDHALRMEEAYEGVRDKWIAERRFGDLVKFVLANWTSGNCVEFMAPLSRALADAGDADLHRQLWARTVKRQATTLFRVLASVGAREPQYLRLMNLNTQGFVETDPAAYRNPERAAAFLLQRLSADLTRWADELRGAGWSADEPERIGQSLQRLAVPRIRTSRPA